MTYEQLRGVRSTTLLILACLSVGSCGSSAHRVNVNSVRAQLPALTPAERASVEANLLPDYEQLGRCTLGQAPGEWERSSVPGEWQTQWFKVMEWEPSAAPADPPGDMTVQVAATRLAVLEGSSPDSTDLYAHQSEARAISTALEQHDSVFVALQPAGKYPRYVIASFAFDEDMHFALLGECTSLLSRGLAVRLDSAAATSAIAAPAGSMIYRLIDGGNPLEMNRALAESFSPTAPPVQEGLPPDTLLNPESVDKSVLEPLRLVKLQLTVPDSWQADKNGAVLCTSIAEGWNDCIPTAQAVSKLITVDIYTNDSNEVSVWLLDSSGNLSAPIAMLGKFTIDVKAVAPAESPRLTVLSASAHLSATTPSVDVLVKAESSTGQFDSGDWVVYDGARWVY